MPSESVKDKIRASQTEAQPETAPVVVSSELKLNFETIGSIAAMVVAAAALFVAWDQGHVMRKQQHASVWPLLTSDFTVNKNTGRYFVEMTLTNDGVGPAIVESASMTANGEDVTSIRDLMNILFVNKTPSGSAGLNGSSVEGSVIGVSQTNTVFRIDWPESEENAAAFQTLGGRYTTGDGPVIAMSVCYCSVFDRCYQLNDADRPQEVRSCPQSTDFLTMLLQTEGAPAQ